ncbi:MAG: hypothetical protein AB7L41_04535 [Flavobacteriaceae bacterium]
MSAQLTFSDRVDAAIDALGRELLRELAATAWFCDGTPDGRHPLIPRGRHARSDRPAATHD